MTRDTDADWRLIASHQPYFGVLSNERFLAENLTEEAVEEFYLSGVGDIAHVVAGFRSMQGRSFAPERAIDFGCGVGRLTFAMAEYAATATGVDVAEAMLDVARARAHAKEIHNVHFSPDIPVNEVDWVHSFIVFQHIPPRRGMQLLTRLVDLIRPNGFLSVQLTFFRDRRHTGEVLRDLEYYSYDGEQVDLISVVPEVRGEMSMYDYDLNRLFAMLFTHGFRAVRAEHTDHNGCHGVLIMGQRDNL